MCIVCIIIYIIIWCQMCIVYSGTRLQLAQSTAYRRACNIHYMCIHRAYIQTPRHNICIHKICIICNQNVECIVYSGTKLQLNQSTAYCRGRNMHSMRIHRAYIQTPIHIYVYYVHHYILYTQHTDTQSHWSKETPPPGGVSYLLCSLIKNRV